MYYLDAGSEKHNRMRIAVLLAVALHVALVLSVSFSGDDTGSNYSPQIEVTLATRPSTNQPREAQHVAQNNQEGGGEEAPRSQLTTRNNAPQATALPARQAPERQSDRQVRRSKDPITTTAETRRKLAKQREKLERELALLEGSSTESDRLKEQLASLEAELDEQTRSYANMPRVKRLTSVSAKQAVDAAYLLDWRRRVEAVGNKYYPEASVRYGIYGSLRLLVVILHDGSLEEIRILSSSGYAVLDEAAIKIVRMAAPYSPFPPELKSTTDKVEIIRTWQFQENRLSSK